jgi:hypothetical protein
VTSGPFQNVPNRDSVVDKSFNTVIVARRPVYAEQALNNEPERISGVCVILLSFERNATGQGAKDDKSCILADYRFEAFYKHCTTSI